MKASKKIVYLLAGLAFFVTACVKDPQDIPPGLTDDPVFKINGSVDQTSFSIGAGEGGWTMLPFVEKLDTITVYTSVFSQDGCLADCSPSWTFRFISELPEQTDPQSNFNNTIHAGEKDWVNGGALQDSFEISISTHPALFMNGVSFWEDLNGSSTIYDNEFNAIVGSQQTLHVCFQSLAYTGCQYIQCIMYQPSTMVPCLARIEPKLEDLQFLSLNVKPQGTPPFQYLWYNNSTASAIVIPLTDSASVVHAEVMVTDALGNSTFLQQTIKLQDGVVDACYFPIEFTSQVYEGSPASTLAGRVALEYRDANGNIWRSNDGIQPPDSYFIIDEVAYYDNSPFGDTAYTVDGRAKVWLFNSLSGESKLFETNQLVLALSHR